MSIDTDQQDLWTSGTAEYHTYRIPALAVTAAGTVLAFCEGRVSGGGDAGEIHLLLRRSTDGGRTWSAPATVVSRAGHTSGNPSPVVDLETGVVHLLFTVNPGDKDETQICAGDGDRRPWRTSSADDGLTWADPVEITAAVKDDSWTWYATGPCHGIQTASGRLVVACDHIVGEAMDRATDPGRAHLVYSDDHGETWTVGAILPNGTNESTVAELGDGRLYVNARGYGDESRRGIRAAAISDDDGTTVGPTTWDGALIEPTCQGSVIWHPDAKALVFANPASRARERLTVRGSRDGGETWSAGAVLGEEPAAYSDLAVTADGTVLCFYERGRDRPYESLRLVRLDVDRVLR